MHPYYAYSFLGGLFIGGYTNLFSKLVISGLVIYIVHPQNFHPQRFTPLYDSIYEKLQPYMSKVYTLSDSISESSISMKSPLPPLSYPSPLSPVPVSLTLKVNK
jgi:hypothetical protein